MKRLAIPAIILSVAVMGCSGGSSTPAATTTTPIAPAPTTTTGSTVYTVQLSPASETPAVTNAESTVSGTATITLNTTKDSGGNVTAATADFQVTSAGFPSGSALTMAHIHLGGVGVKGGILVDTGFAGGSGSFQKTGVNVTADIAQAILKTPGNYYFNIHSTLNPGGVARGQLDNSGNPTAPNPGSGTGPGY